MIKTKNFFLIKKRIHLFKTIVLIGSIATRVFFVEPLLFADDDVLYVIKSNNWRYEDDWIKKKYYCEIVTASNF